MITPTPRQQAGYLRRLLRRGELRIVDPNSGRRVQALIELADGGIRLTPVLSHGAARTCANPEDARWLQVFERLRRCLRAEEAEELAEVIEAESRKSSLVESLGS